MRQAASQPPQLDFVKLTRLSGHTRVELDAADVAVGSYELVLESYDANSSVRSTLKTDTITVHVEAAIKFPSEADLPLIQLVVGSDKSWTLADSLIELAAAGLSVQVQLSDELRSFVSYSAAGHMFTYNGDAASVQLVNEFT